jgi:tetratricopeptide (TPR) repeat protein
MTKATWASSELKDLGLVKQFRYLMDAEVAADSLQPTESIAAADQMFQKGLELMRRGGHGVPGIFRRDRMIEAAETFRALIERYPTSDKIDDAAFYCGEIHKEYLPGQEAIAVKWYERCFVWNPQTEHPARFQAAVVYDYRLQDRDKALELYRAAVRQEAGHSANVRFASSRISELTGDGAVLAAPPGQ